MDAFHSKGYSFATAANSSIITIGKQGSPELVTITKMPEEKLQFTTKNSDNKTQIALIDALKICLDPGATIKIELKGGTPAEQKKLKDELWLKAVSNGLKVANHQPDEDFLRAHKVPPEYAPSTSAPRSAK